MPRKSDKRERLISAADELIHKQTFNATTLADIAKLADVPLGNVYYYFKTKEAILEAVINLRSSILSNQFATWDTLSDVKARLKEFINSYIIESELTAQFGNAVGTLCQELSKKQGPLSALASNLMQETLSWLESQFKQMGHTPEKSKILAEHFFANLQGISILTLTFKDPNFILRQQDILEKWLEMQAVAA